MSQTWPAPAPAGFPLDTRAQAPKLPSKPEPTPDELLVQRALAGTPRAHRELVTRLLDTISREVAFVLRRYAGDRTRDPRQDLRDLVQEVFVVLFEREGQELRRWDPARGRSLDSYVRLVARRKVARVLGQRRGNPWADDPIDPEQLDRGRAADDEDGLTQELEERNELAVVLRALYAQMSARDIELFEALFVEQSEPGEVAERLGMSRGAVNAWSYRMRKLARNLGVARLNSDESGAS